VRSVGVILAVLLTSTHAADKDLQCGAATADAAAAIQACTRLIEFGSLERHDLARAYYSRGTQWAAQANHDRALADFGLALDLDPNLAVAHYNRALSWSARDETDRAIADYDAALKLTPSDGDAWIGRAVEWTSRGDYTRALADYDGAIRVRAESAAAYFGRGRVRFYAGDYVGAAADFSRTHRIEPSIYTALWLYLARRRADISGEQTLAHEAGTSGDGLWPAPIVALYLGKSAPDAVLRAAAHPDPVRSRELRCEASFYVGEWHLLRGARDAAEPLLRAAGKRCARTFIEREGAIAELRKLQKP
jgi:lipoprotein NlpI